MAVKNSTILTRAWLEASSDFQQRIPNPQVNSYANVIEHLFAPQNADLFNAFTGLLNGVAGVYVESKRFNNPLRDIIMKPATRFGNSERHVAVRFLQAHSGRLDSEDLLKLELPKFREFFYSVNEPRRYEFSWPREQLRRAFYEDGYGFEDLLAATIDQAYSSDAYDEMNIFIQCFAEADQRLGGLYREHLSAAPTTEATSRELLQKIRAIAGRMKFPTMLYNHIDIPVHETGETLVLWVTPETMSFIDVFGLATVFQLDKADIKYRIIEIPEFPIPNVYAALTSEDFIFARDFQYGMEPPFYNPATQTYKYYLWHQELIGVNPVANCVLFTTDEQTVIPTITITPTGIDITATETELAKAYPGGIVQLAVDLTGTGAEGNIAVEPDAGLFSVSAIRGDAAIPLNSATFVDSYGRLHIQKTGIQADDVITVAVKSAYINPSGATTTFTDTLNVTIVAKPAQGAKECSVETDPFITYTDETDIVTASE